MALDNIIRERANDPDAWFFEDMLGTLHRRGEQLQVYQRLGLDDKEWRKTGTRARQSTITTISYHSTRSAALASIDLAMSIIGEEREIVKHGILYGTFVIENVTQTGEIMAVANAIGTYETNPTARLQLQWTVSLQPEPAPAA